MQVLCVPGRRVAIRGCEWFFRRADPSDTIRVLYYAAARFECGLSPASRKADCSSSPHCARSPRRMTRSLGPQGSHEHSSTDQPGTDNMMLFVSSQIKKQSYAFD